MKKTPATVAPNAPQPIPEPIKVQEAPRITYIQPRQRRIERQGSDNVPVTAVYPRVIGGVCEYCGVLDKNVPAQFQYKLCPHYRGMQLRCSYCEADKDPDEIVYHANLNVRGSPTDPEALVVFCDSYKCTKKHQDRYKISG